MEALRGAMLGGNSKVVKFSKVGEICMGDSGGWQSLTPVRL